MISESYFPAGSLKNSNVLIHNTTFSYIPGPPPHVSDVTLLSVCLKSSKRTNGHYRVILMMCMMLMCRTLIIFDHF